MLSIGIALYGGAERTPKQPWEIGWAIRREWPDGGHDFFGFAWDPEGLDTRVAQDMAYWRKAPVKPVAYANVQISRRDFVQHGRDRSLCRAPDCSTLPAEPVTVREVTR